MADRAGCGALYDGAGAGVVRRPGKQLALAALLLLLAACSEHTLDGGSRVLPRPDGVLVIYQKTWYRDRWRLPMDHSAAEETTAQVYQAVLYPATGGPPHIVPLDLAVDFDNLPAGLVADYPMLVWRNNALAAELCREGPDMSVDCSTVPSAAVGQVHGRIEDVAQDGTRLVLAQGPDGSANCAVDLATVDPTGRADLILAHYPGRGSYLFDRGDADLPLYRLQCGQAPALLTNLAVPGVEWTEVIDIAPGPDPANPLVLYSTRARFEQAIVRDMHHEIVALDTGAIARSDAYFLDASGARVVLADDGLFRHSPGLKLTVYTVATAERRTLEWNHALPPYPDRP